jgi:hypothetical protein
MRHKRNVSYPSEGKLHAGFKEQAVTDLRQTHTRTSLTTSTPCTHAEAPQSGAKKLILLRMSDAGGADSVAALRIIMWEDIVTQQHRKHQCASAMAAVERALIAEQRI